MTRPLGITILAILAIIFGAAPLFFALATFGVLGSEMLGATAQLGQASLFLGILSLVVGALYLAFGIGAWTLKPWAWTLGVWSQVLALIQACFHLFSSGRTVLVDALIAAVILYYLFRPHVKQAFGRA